MKGTFYNVLKEALALTDLELARIWSVFGVVGTISYISGGYLTDRISPRKIVTAALCISGILHIWVSFVPCYPLILCISALMGLTAVFAFFPASSKVLSFLGNEGHSGSIFGLYYALEGLGGMVINLTGTRIFEATASAGAAFCFVTRAFAALNFIAAIGVTVCLPKTGASAMSGSRISLEQLRGGLLKRKEVWLIAMIMLCNFWSYCTITYITPYLTELFAMPEKYALLLGVVRINVLALLAGIIFGRLTDWKGSAVNVIGKTMILQVMILAGIASNHLLVGSVSIAVLLTTIFSFAATGVKVISLVMISECHFSAAMTGTVIGVVCFIGYSPEAFTYPVVGWFVEGQKDAGYLIMFVISLLLAAAAALGSISLYRIRERNEKRSGRITDITEV